MGSLHRPNRGRGPSPGAWKACPFSSTSYLLLQLRHRQQAPETRPLGTGVPARALLPCGHPLLGKLLETALQTSADSKLPEGEDPPV